MEKSKKDSFKLIGLKLENKPLTKTINHVWTVEIYGKNLK